MGSTCKEDKMERPESPEMLDEAEVGISERLYEQVSLMAAEEGCTEEEVVGMALRSYLDPAR